MATRILSSPVVPFPAVPSVQQITQEELSALLDSRSLLAQLEKRVREQEAAIRQHLEAGASVESGPRVAGLKENWRTSVAWKEKAIDLAERLGLNGEGWAQNVLSHTKPSRSVSLVVE